MKKIFTLLVSAVLTMMGANAQNVNIPDANFKAALVGEPVINTNNDGEIQVSEAAAFTGTIDVSYHGINDLTGIEAFTGIKELYCTNNDLTALDVSHNTLLTLLRCNVNHLTALDVSNNTQLNFFTCSYNPLTALDVSANTALRVLNCFNMSLLTSLNMKNGNNVNLLSLGVGNNPLLTCIQVDDPTYMNANWGWAKDASANYSSSCGCQQYFASLTTPSGNAASVCNGSPVSLAVNITGASASNTYFDITYTDGISTNTTTRVFATGSNVIAPFAVSPAPAQTTTYKLISIADANGCPGFTGPAASDTFENITVRPLPVVTSTPSNTSNLCPGTAVVLSTPPVSGASYTWSNGRNSRNITVYTTDNYTVTVGGCTSVPSAVSYQNCDAPAGISITSPANTTALVNFAAASCGQTYEIRYKIKAAGSTWVNITGISSSPYTITGLLPNTQYLLQMRTKCSSTPVRYSTWSTQYYFITATNFISGIGRSQSYTTHPANGATAISISLSPNPASNHAVLHINGNTGNVSAVISNMSGKQLWQSQNIAVSQINLPVQNLAAGVYMVTVTDGENKQMLKLVKE